MIAERPRYSVKAGRFIFDETSKKVKLCKDKGQLSVYVNNEDETHLSWVNIDSNLEEINIIIFGFDSIFEKLPQNNTFLLRFQSSNDKYFFWLQQKVDPQQFVQQVNAIIKYEIPMDIQLPEQPSIQPKIEPNISRTQNHPHNLHTDFIKKIQESLESRNKQQTQNSITHLNKIFGAEASNILLKELSEGETAELIDFLPEQQKDGKYLESNIRSAQFLQALDALSDALNSENVLSLFMELGLDRKYLKEYYGVDAFVKALEEWGKQFAKKE